MSRKDNLYVTSCLLDRNRPDDREVIFKFQNRDKSRYHSISDYVKAAILAFDDGRRIIDFSEVSIKELAKEIVEVVLDAYYLD